MIFPSAAKIQPSSDWGAVTCLCVNSLGRSFVTPGDSPSVGKLHTNMLLSDSASLKLDVLHWTLEVAGDTGEL